VDRTYPIQQLPQLVEAVVATQLREEIGLGLVLERDPDVFVQWVLVGGDAHVEAGVAGLGAGQRDRLSALGFGPSPDRGMQGVWVRATPEPTGRLHDLVQEVLLAGGARDDDRLAVFPEALDLPGL
jgi:hypothetical protein